MPGPQHGRASIPFRQHKTLNINCFVRDPVTLEPLLPRPPLRGPARPRRYLRTTGIADTVYFGPEAEFFIFDDVRYSQDQRSAFYQVDSIEGTGTRARDEEPEPRLQDPRPRRATSPSRRPTTSRTCAPR